MDTHMRPEAPEFDLPIPSQAPAASSIPSLPLELEPPEDFRVEWDGQSLPPCSAHKAWNVMMDAAGRERWANRNNPEPVARETHPSRVRPIPPLNAGIEAWGAAPEHDAEPAPAGDTHPSRIRPLEDNVLLYLKPRPSQMAGSLLTLPQNRAGRSTGAREAIVLATGPGWRLRGGRGPIVPTEVEPGDCVAVDSKAGQDWALDVGKPRTNPRGCSWESFPVPTELERIGGEYRMVRADEILFVIESQRPEDEALELEYGDLGERGTKPKSGWSR